MKRFSAVALLMTLATVVPPTAARADHVPSAAFPKQASLPNAPLQRSGDIRFITNLPGGRGVAAPMGENGPFTRNGRRYLSASSTVYGLHTIDVTDPTNPVEIGDYASAAGCPTQMAEYLLSGLNPANPTSFFGKIFGGIFGALGGWENDSSFTPDGRIAVLGMDAPGRCHDPAMGGLEFVDMTDLTNPRTLHLTRNVGEAHSVTIDPTHPWLAYISTSDGNDFIEIVDFKSCLGGVAALAACNPVTARAVLSPDYMPGIPRNADDPSRDPVGEGCHDIRFRGNRLYCAAINTTLIIDTSEVLDANGELTGTHLDCPQVDAQRAAGVKVTTCAAWTETAFANSGFQSVKMRAVSVIVHDTRKPATQDISISHQAEPIENGTILAVTDERGGGLGAGDRDEGGECPGGGIWFYDIRDEARPRLMQTPSGAPAVFFTENTVSLYASCTVHYGQQLPDERVLAFAWYTGGTHVMTYDIDWTTSPATFDIQEKASYTSIGGWTIQALPMQRNPHDPNEVIVYAADQDRGIDVFAVKLPRA